jgi:hypothetical protein
MYTMVKQAKAKFFQGPILCYCTYKLQISINLRFYMLEIAGRSKNQPKNRDK